MALKIRNQDQGEEIITSVTIRFDDPIYHAPASIFHTCLECHQGATACVSIAVNYGAPKEYWYCNDHYLEPLKKAKAALYNDPSPGFYLEGA